MFDGLKKKLAGALKGFIKQEAEEVKEEEKVIGERKAEKEPEELVKLSLKTKIKGVVFGSASLGEAEIERFTDSLKISLLESDVSYGATEEFLENLKTLLKEEKFDSKHMEKEITDTVRASLMNVLMKAKSSIELRGFVREQVAKGNIPVKILFLGPNGTGKTTTIAKIAHSFKSSGIGCVLSASDTFRAAAIEQIEHHAKKIGVPIIKSKYGADPASIAFDAIAYARAHEIDAVLIDSAGRQETNKSLINEVQKMARVVKPDITIFVGESTSGNVIAEQIKEFGKYVKIDGIILTKLDLDAKGGNAISISHTTGVPILFFGVGEAYETLIPYSPEYVVNAILPKAA